MQSEVPGEMRGRIGSALGTLIRSANVASMALAGLAAALVDTRGVFIGSGAFAILAGLLTVWLFRGVVPGTTPEPSVA